jgi:predicted P-loop ATPase
MAPPRSGPPLPPIQFEALAAALLARADQLVPAWLPGGAQRGHEWQCADLGGGAGGSCSVNLSNGAWADFAGDERGGDLISLYAAIHGLGPGQAALQLARAEGLEDVAGVARAPGGQAAKPIPVARPAVDRPAPKPAAPDEGWATVRPVPPGMPAPSFKHMHRRPEDIEHVARYQAGDALHGYVVRFRTSDGGKDTLPHTWCSSRRDGAARWHWRQFDEPRPLYLPAHALRPGATVVVVEGEKKADALQALLDAGAGDQTTWQVVSWPGGGKAWKMAEWRWLASPPPEVGGNPTQVLLWPDCDAKHQPLTKAERDATPDPLAREAAKQAKPLLPADKQPGLSTMLGLGRLLQDEHHCAVQLLPIPEPGAVADGWDCADAIHEGWDYAAMQALFARAAPLPPPPAPAHAVAASDGAAAPSADGSGRVVAGPWAGSGPAATSRERPVGTGSGDGADGGGGGAGGGGGNGAVPEWLEPYWDDKNQKWRVSRKLVIAALTHDPALTQVGLGLNQLSNNIETRSTWPWLHGRAGPVGNSTDLQLGAWLSRQYGLPAIARAALLEGIETVAHLAPFHPVREWLAAQRWDNKPRINTWLIHTLGETPETLPPKLREYLALVGRYWLLGMVNRVMQPGCKFDYCPVLEGKGGLGKSTLVEVLASAEYFSDTHFDVSRGHEAQEQVQGLWLYEIAELSNFSRADVALIKAFISAKVDRYRAAYGRTVESFQRQCVMVGTTNERAYLRDRLGNRRFWPVPVRNPIRIEWLKRWRDQLLAEAFQLYQEGTNFTPTREEEARLFEPMQELRLAETAVTEELRRLLSRDPDGSDSGKVVNNLADFVTLNQLVKAMGTDAGKSSAALESQIRTWLEHEGWERSKKQLQGVRAWGYARPKGWGLTDWTDTGEADANEFEPLAVQPGAPSAREPSPSPSSPPPASAGGPINEFGDADDAPF